MKSLLKNCKIYDGTGSEPFMGDILIDGDKVVKVAPAIDAEGADKVYDLGGLSVSSGFIDGHSHNDWFAIKKDPIPYFDPFIRQGITTFVTGNCGISEIGFEKDCEYVDKMVNEMLVGSALYDGSELYNDKENRELLKQTVDELVQKGTPATMEEVMKNLKERDYIDSHRETSPLRRAEDAFELDNSDMNLHEELVWIQGLIQGKFGILG